MTEQEIDDLFAAMLTGDYDDDQPWEAVKTLRRNGNRLIFEKASMWSQSSGPIKRARCADVLCQLRKPDEQHGDPIFADESFTIISGMIETEADERALRSELFGLGHLRQDGSVAILTRYEGHVSEDVRFAAAWGLGSFSYDPKAIESLIRLSDDPDDDVRDWSLFALGTQSEADTPELRDALARHLDDAFANAREEAIAGLAKRKDTRAVLPLLKLMEADSYFIRHVHDFEALVEEERGCSAEWDADDFIDALYRRFPDMLPPRAVNPETE